MTRLQMETTWAVLGQRHRYPMNRFTKYSIRTLLFASFVSAIGVAVYDHFSRSYVVVKVARPNSGAYSQKEASKLLDECLERTRGIPANHDVILECP